MLLVEIPYFMIIALCVYVGLVFAKEYFDYKSGTYFQITKLPYISVRNNLGRYGEYLTYKYLRKYEKDGAKFLFNIYIPKEDGQTTEIDVLMISKKGVFVFESKNYSGWIFGNEKQQYWYQTLPKGRGRSHKERFFNPIMQNKSHIKHLIPLLPENTPIKSIIVFSERCTLKSIDIYSDNVIVANRGLVYSVVTKQFNATPSDLLSTDTIEEIYDKLYPLTQVSESTKARHISNIKGDKACKSLHHIDDDDYPPVQQDVPEPTVAYEESSNEIPSSESTPDVQCCPRCGGKLILRTARRGENAGKQFYGCSNYPKCRYIQNI